MAHAAARPARRSRASRANIARARSTWRATCSRKPAPGPARLQVALGQAGKVDAVERPVLAHVAHEVRQLEGHAEPRDLVRRSGAPISGAMIRPTAAALPFM